MYLSLIILSLLLVAWMNLVEPRRYEITRKNIKLNKKPASPLRILHLSDLHFRKFDSGLSRFFDRLAQQRHDLVFVTGDFIDAPDGFQPCLENLKKLKPEYGFYGVWGNHDHYLYSVWDMTRHFFSTKEMPRVIQPVDEYEKMLRDSLNLRILKNETVELNCRGTELLIHGLDDFVSRKSDTAKVLTACDPGKINVLLTHSLDAVQDIEGGKMDLVFAGHSHGGQICLPWIGPVFTHTRMGPGFASGHLRYKGAECFISRGLGTNYFFHFRLLCRPEVLFLQIAADA